MGRALHKGFTDDASLASQQPLRPILTRIPTQHMQDVRHRASPFPGHKQLNGGQEPRDPLCTTNKSG